jgi:NAD(P)-dependent dehydrogenase (short-subunit alcohol dehydrogenase family)
MPNEQVLVTGSSGFIGAHCILQLLDAGYRVRTTVRSLKREPDVRAMLETGGVSPNSLDQLTFFVADLEQDGGWPEGRRSLRLCAARCIAAAAECAEARRRAHHPRTRGHAPRSARRARCRRSPRCAHIVLRRHRLRPQQPPRALRRNRLDGAQRRRVAIS